MNGKPSFCGKEIHANLCAHEKNFLYGLYGIIYGSWIWLPRKVNPGIRAHSLSLTHSLSLSLSLSLTHHTHTHTHTHSHTHTYTHIHTHAHTHTHTYRHTYAHIHTQSHRHTHAHTQTHIHTFTNTTQRDLSFSLCGSRRFSIFLRWKKNSSHCCSTLMSPPRVSRHSFLYDVFLYYTKILADHRWKVLVSSFNIRFITPNSFSIILFLN